MITTDRSEELKIIAERLGRCEAKLITARKAYIKALKSWEASAQVKLETEEKN
jgi:hypothetical protein